MNRRIRQKKARQLREAEAELRRAAHEVAAAIEGRVARNPTEAFLIERATLRVGMRLRLTAHVTKTVDQVERYG